jgi:AcrR family transcriptional regulator
MPKIIDKQEKKNLILESATKCFYLKGYHLTKMEDIALSANIGKGTIYEYFKNKEDIILFSLEESFNEVYSYFLNILNAKASFKDKFHSIIIYHQESMQSNKELFIVYLELLNSSKHQFHKNFKSKISSFYSKITNLFEKLILQAIKNKEIKKNTNAKLISHILLNSLDGICQNSSIFHYNQKILKNLYSEFENIYLNHLIGSKN